MNDTREQLERSIDRFLGSWTGWSVSIKVLREAIIGWLDRQAAITERETNKTYNKSVENVTDSRAQLEADLWKEIREYAGEFHEGEEILFALILAMFDRQAAITEAEGFKKALSLLEGRDSHIAELQAKMDYLEGHGVEIVDAVAGGYEVYNEWYRKADELQAKLDKARNEREMYRECFGKSVDKADEIRAIMAGMGMK